MILCRDQPILTIFVIVRQITLIFKPFEQTRWDMARTDDAERVAAYIAQEPLLAESVYFGAKYFKGNREKEVTDLLLIHRDFALAIQMKSQQCLDDSGLVTPKLQRWVEKSAAEGLKQLRGTIRTLHTRNFWCQHPTFGRVDFDKGQLTLIHGIVVVEHRARGLSLSETLPLAIDKVPISYFTLSDFLNHVKEFRAFSDICKYLNERHRLPELDHRLTGREDELRAHYFLNNGHFPNGLTQEERLGELYTKRSDFERFWLQKQLGDDECKETEAVARSLRRRAAGYPPRHPDDKNYRAMQSALMDLTYGERRLVGRKIRQAGKAIASNGVRGKSSCTHLVLPKMNNITIMVTASRGVDPDAATKLFEHLLEKFQEYIRSRRLLWIHIRENSPKYQFLYAPLKNVDYLMEGSHENRNELLSEWVTYSPEARF